MRAAISIGEFDTLLAFAHRAAVFAIRDHNAPWAIDGLTAITMIEAERIDWREILIALGLVHHGATRAGLDADQLFRDLSMLAEPGTGELIRGFAKRAPSNKRLEAWRYEEVETDAGIGLIELGTDGRGFGTTKPTYDLIAIAAEMADYFVSDKYRLATIGFGTIMPRIWLESKDDTALNEALEAVRTGASISAEVQPTTGVEAFSQHFQAFLLEMRTEAAVQQLLDVARKKQPTFFCKVELAAGRLFCLIVARSFREGTESYETQETLKRFLQPIGDILRRYAVK